MSGRKVLERWKSQPHKGIAIKCSDRGGHDKTTLVDATVWPDHDRILFDVMPVIYPGRTRVVIPKSSGATFFAAESDAREFQCALCSRRPRVPMSVFFSAARLGIAEVDVSLLGFG